MPVPGSFYLYSGNFPLWRYAVSYTHLDVYKRQVIDPPRKGVEPAVIDAIAQAAPKRVVYVSCNVATQARDAALFVAVSYTHL